MLPSSAALPASYGTRDAGAAGAFAGYPVQAHPVQQQQQQILTTSPPPETQARRAMLSPRTGLPLGTPAPVGAPDAGAAGGFAGYPVQAHPVQQQQQQTLTTSPPPETQVTMPVVLHPHARRGGCDGMGQRRHACVGLGAPTRIFILCDLPAAFACSVHVPAVLKAKLEAVQTKGKTLEDVEEEVVRLCAGEGAILSTAKSTRCRDGATDRVDMKKLICTRGGKSRQLEYEASLDTAPGVQRRNVKGSARTGCPFEVSVRHAKSHRWPRISNMKLTHNHSVDRKAIDVKLRLASKLTEEQLGQVKQMTS
ncbi:unnamed protein product, partial [Ectocarpus sp. 8 AP-2014]